MKKILALLPLISLLLLPACEEETDCNCQPEAGSLTVQFAERWGDQGFGFNEPLSNVSGYDVYVQNFRFYISDLQAVKDDGEVINLADIKLYDLDTENDRSTFTVPSGTYTALKFGVGVPAEMNGTNNPNFEPSQYGQDHPLSINNGMYWTWQAGYKFMIFEGRYDPSGSGNADSLATYPTFSFHTGRDTCYRQINYNVGFTVNEDQAELKVIMDTEKFFYIAGDTIDLEETANFHGNLDNIETAIDLSDNMAESISVLVE